jgi:hypothetical protein
VVRVHEPGRPRRAGALLLASNLTTLACSRSTAKALAFFGLGDLAARRGGARARGRSRRRRLVSRLVRELADSDATEEQRQGAPGRSCARSRRSCSTRSKRCAQPRRTRSRYPDRTRTALVDALRHDPRCGRRAGRRSISRIVQLLRAIADFLAPHVREALPEAGSRCRTRVLRPMTLVVALARRAPGRARHPRAVRGAYRELA